MRMTASTVNGVSVRLKQTGRYAPQNELITEPLFGVEHPEIMASGISHAANFVGLSTVILPLLRRPGVDKLLFPEERESRRHRGKQRLGKSNHDAETPVVVTNRSATLTTARMPPTTAVCCSALSPRSTPNAVPIATAPDTTFTHRVFDAQKGFVSIFVSYCANVMRLLASPIL